MKKTKWIAMSLVGAMLMATVLSGCGGDAKTDSKPPDDTGSTGKSESAVSPSGEPISWDSPDMAWRKNKDKEVTIDCYLDFDWYVIDTWGKDDVSKEITKRTGISLNVTKSSDRNQLQVLLAADELPEMVFTDNQPERFYLPDISYSFDELINEHAPEFMELIDPVEIVNNTIEDGHFYTLRSHYNSAEAWEDPRNLPSPGDPGLYIRSDIMEKLGNPKLDSLEDLESIFATVKEKYPELVVFQPHPSWQNPLIEFMGLRAPTATYVDPDGTVKLGMADPDFVEFVVYMNRLYRNEYLSAEAFTYRPEQFFQIVRSGSVFSASYNTGLADESNRLYYDANDIDAHLVPVTKPLSYKEESNFAPIDAGIGWASLIITKKCKNPDRAIQYMEFLKSPEGDQLTQWGIEGQHYTLTDEGLLLRPEGFAALKATETGVGPWYFMASGLGEGVATMSSKVSQPNYCTNTDLLSMRKKYYVREPALYFANPQADTDEMIIKTKLTELWTNSQVPMITADSEDACRQLFAEFQQNCQKSGMDTLTEYQTEQYNIAKERYDKIAK